MGSRFGADQCQDLEWSSFREWLLTDGAGNFAMGTVSGIATRRYHGHLVAAPRPGAERMLLLAAIEAHVESDHSQLGLSSNQYPGAVFPEGYRALTAFEASSTAVRWTFASGDIRAQKTLRLARNRPGASITYSNLGQETLRLSLRPLVAHRSYHGNFYESPNYPGRLEFSEDSTTVHEAGVPLVLMHPRASRSSVQGWYFRFEHVREAERGLDPRDDLFCPCELGYLLAPGESATLQAVVGSGALELDADDPLEPEWKGAESLAHASRIFAIETPERPAILAGYPWFSDWGRDTMISLPGVLLANGCNETARRLLDGYASHFDQGLLPNRFPERGGAPETNTSDATLWFVDALYQTLRSEWDEPFAVRMMAACDELFLWHMRGTRHGIGVDPADGLLRQGETGMQLTWMDAKIGDWVVTPRHGKPVEVNGLWIHALRVMEWLAEKLQRSTEKYRKAAERAEGSFESRFWCGSRGHYFDCIDPDDASLRPNQLIPMALAFGPARGERAREALDLIEAELLTPFGVRTLGPREPHYRGRFEGNMAARDAAYHQGTVWPWLFGPYLSAILRLTADRQRARALLEGAAARLFDAQAIGGMAEVFDGDEPQRPGGCPFQCWSVAELARVWWEFQLGVPD